MDIDTNTIAGQAKIAREILASTQSTVDTLRARLSSTLRPSDSDTVKQGVVGELKASNDSPLMLELKEIIQNGNMLKAALISLTDQIQL